MPEVLETEQTQTMTLAEKLKEYWGAYAAAAICVVTSGVSGIDAYEVANSATKGREAEVALLGGSAVLLAASSLYLLVHDIPRYVRARAERQTELL